MHRKIYINGRFLLSPQTGVERYAYNICASLAELGVEFYVICPKNGEINHSYDVSRLKIIRYGFGNSHFWEQLILPYYFIRKNDYVLVSLMGLGSIFVAHKIMTIHDLSFLFNPSWFSKAYYYYYKVMTPIAVRSSKGIITVSEFSKSEILRFYKFLKPENIKVVYNAVSSSLTETSTSTRIKGEKYFLAVSSMDPRKNFIRLIQAFNMVPGYKLKIAGGVNRVFKDTAFTENVDGIEFLGRVNDEQLRKLYRNAEAFIFPSLYEGFGLPPIEAMAFGCPVLASDIPVLHEVCGDVALYFTPTSPDNIRDCLLKYISMSDIAKANMIDKGRKRAAMFSWTVSAQNLLHAVNDWFDS